MVLLFDKILQSKAFILEKVKTVGKTAVVLGTAMGDFAASMTGTVEINYEDIPHFPVSTVQSHQGKIIFGYKSGVPVIVMSGRTHYYEGYSTSQLTYPVRVLKELGIENIIMTNAAGGVNPHFREGDIVMVEDHINFLPDHPLRGQNDERLGPRFPDMLHAYNREIMEIFSKLGTEQNISLKRGVYLCLQGPSLETPAEYRMAHYIGADLVGMSTVPEVIVAKHAGMNVCVFSIVSNVCFPASVLTETTIEDVIKVVRTSAASLNILLDKYFESL